MYALSPAELEQRFERLGVDPAAEGDDSVVALQAAQLARAHARVAGGCALCARADARLSRASLGARDASTACSLGLELARLRARQARDASGAYAAAYVLTQRFADHPERAACVAEAQRMLDLLADHRPSVDALRQALAHGSEPLAEQASSDADLTARVVDDADTRTVDGTAFARAHGDSERALLESVAVLGHADDEKAREVRIVLGFDRVAAFRRTELPASDGLPRRLVLDLDHAGVSSAVPEVVPVSRAGVMRVRTFALDESRTRVAFDIHADTAYRLFFLPNPYRVIIDFRTVTRAATASAVRTIVLDPGHGGSQPGARGPNGLEEGAVALSLSLRVQRILRSKLPGTRVVLTRDRDRAMSLEERSAMANALDADLFVSIHLNASASPTDRGGVSTFVLDTSDDAQALRLAARENESAVAEVTSLQKLFASLYRKDQVERSLSLAHKVQASTLRWGRKHLPELPDRGVKKALFYVLVGASMPAVLIEASFITRPDEASALATDEYRQALAEGIAEGILSYAEGAAGARASAP